MQPFTEDVMTEMVSPSNKLVVVNDPIGDGEPIEIPLIKNSYRLAPDDVYVTLSFSQIILSMSDEVNVAPGSWLTLTWRLDELKQLLDSPVTETEKLPIPNELEFNVSIIEGWPWEILATKN